MPINTNLNTAPYYDDFDLENQYYRVLFKPGFAVQAREMIQLQSVLQSQIEQFGDNIFKEGSIVKGCTFTDLNDLQFVRVNDDSVKFPGTNFDPTVYISRRITEDVGGGIEADFDYVYQVVGGTSGLIANIIQAARGFENRAPELNTLFINYLNTSGANKQFINGEELTINEYKYKVGELEPLETNPIESNLDVDRVNATSLLTATGNSFGVQVSPGIIFQKGHFLFADSQTVVVSKYNNTPDGVNVGFQVNESLISALQDSSLYDNANGSLNENAPGADRLRLLPQLVVLPESDAESDASFFSLIRYKSGNAVTLRDVSQYNVIGEEMARRTYEESGNYILQNFGIKTETRGSDVKAVVGAGTAYIKGFRVESTATQEFTIDPIVNTETTPNIRVGFDYGNYLKITGYNGWLPLSYTPANLQNNSGTDIGTCIVTNVTLGKVYVSGVRMDPGQNFASVERIAAGAGYLSVASGSTMQETKRAPRIFDTGASSLFATSQTNIPVRRLTTGAGVVADQIVLTAPPGNDFGLDQSDIIVIDATSTQIPVTNTTLALNNSQLTIDLQPGLSASTANVYYNENFNLISPQNKVTRDTHIRTTYNSSKARYTLGAADAYKLISVVDINGKDVTSSFRLVTNQKDAYYDHSYIEYVSGSEAPAAGNMSINFEVFELSQSTGEYFFTINSYPNGLTPSDIPVYEADNGQKFNLRECFDFRPHVNPLGSFSFTATNPATAPIINDNVDATSPIFTTYGDPLFPATGKFAETTLEYYLSRYDLIVLSSYGTMELIKGEEEKNAVPPKVESDKLSIAELFIPGNPALSQQAAIQQGKKEYAIRCKQTGVKNYTMKDLHDLEKKIEGMEYYISLNQLEQDTQNLVVTDENGLNRFKNGFVVEPFNDLKLAEIKNPRFNASVKFNQHHLAPSVKTFPIDLKYGTSTGTSLFPATGETQVTTLSRNQNISIINQPFATNSRNCVSNFYKYVGLGFASPPYDAAYDTTTNPVTIDVDFSEPLQDLVDNIQELSPLTDTTVTTTGVNTRFGGGVQTTTTSSLEIGGSTTQTVQVGEFVSDIRMNPYMAPRDIRIFMSGLRPNTRHYFFFDKVDVNANVFPGSNVNNVESVRRNGTAGASVSSDANGVLRAVFRIPAETFFVGERNLEIYDVAQYSDIESASTSGGFVTYNAYNFSIEKSSVTVSTRFPTYDVSQVTTVRNLPQRPIVRNDPLAQTFFIKEGMGAGSKTVFISQLEVFFKRKSALNGVTFQLREVLNGYPTSKIIPFSSVHFTPAEVNVSDDASVATTVSFNAPIRLDVEKEYCFVIQPDANDPDYLVFTSKVGGLDLTPGPTQNQPIVQDWGDGVLFTSTNNRAWKSYQDEDVKFNLYRHDFNASTGSVTLTHNDHEFFTMDGATITGRFNVGETVYAAKPLQGATQSTISMVTGTNVITGTALDETYQVGEYILVANSGNTVRDVFEIASIDSAIQITTVKETAFAVTGGTGTPVVIGDISYYNFRKPTTMHLEKSSATASKLFAAADVITGLDSGSTATIASVDDISVSYFQPIINRANDPVSKTTLTGEFIDPENTLTSYQIPLKFADDNIMAPKGALIYSRSNDIGEAQAFNLIVSLDNGGNTTSTPIVDVETSKLLCYQYQITNSSDTTSAYIGKKIELNADLDAEDIKVILTGYKPTGTDIKVYARPQNAFDSDKFDSIPWIELELREGVGIFSSVTNKNDWREFTYQIPDANKPGGVTTYTSNAGEFSSFRRFAIKIELLSPNNYIVPRVKDFRGIALT